MILGRNKGYTPGGVAPLGHGKRDGARRIQVIRVADDAVDGGRVRSEAKLNEALREYIPYSVFIS